MRKMTAVIAGFLMLAGCACTKPNKEKLLRRALADTNVVLGECRDENQALHRVVQKQHKEILKLKKRG